MVPVLASDEVPARQRLVKVVQFLVFGALAVLLWQAFDGQEAARLLLVADLWLAIAAGLVLTVQTLLSAVRWRLTAAKLGIALSPGTAVREYYLGQFINLSLPGGVIGDAGRAYRSRQETGVLIAGQAVIFERFAGQLGLLAVFLGGLCLAALSPTGLGWPAWLVWSVLWLLVALGAIPIVALAGFRLLGPAAQPLKRMVDRFAQAVLEPDVIVQQISLSLITALCNVGAFALCALALGLAMPVISIVTLVPLILLAMLVPISISGWGVREGAAAVLLPILGATASEGLAISVLFGLTFLASTLAGFALSWLAKFMARRQILTTNGQSQR